MYTLNKRDNSTLWFITLAAGEHTVVGHFGRGRAHCGWSLWPRALGGRIVQVRAAALAARRRRCCRWRGTLATGRAGRYTHTHTQKEEEKEKANRREKKQKKEKRKQKKEMKESKKKGVGR